MLGVLCVQDDKAAGSYRGRTERELCRSREINLENIGCAAAVIQIGGFVPLRLERNGQRPAFPDVQLAGQF